MGSRNPPAARRLEAALVTAAMVGATALVLLLLLGLPAVAQAEERAVSGVTLTSPNPGELVITWEAPSRAPSDYRVTWKKSDGKWPSHRDEPTVNGGNAFPTGTSHTSPQISPDPHEFHMEDKSYVRTTNTPQANHAGDNHCHGPDSRNAAGHAGS